MVFVLKEQISIFFSAGALLSIVVGKILKMPPLNISAPGYSNTNIGSMVEKLCPCN